MAVTTCVTHAPCAIDIETTFTMVAIVKIRLNKTIWKIYQCDIPCISLQTQWNAKKFCFFFTFTEVLFKNKTCINIIEADIAKHARNTMRKCVFLYQKILSCARARDNSAFRCETIPATLIMMIYLRFCLFCLLREYFLCSALFSRQMAHLNRILF